MGCGTDYVHQDGSRRCPPADSSLRRHSGWRDFRCPADSPSAGGSHGSLFPSWQAWISHLLYVQNWWMPLKEPGSPNIFGHFWSLGIEEQFYLAWPLSVWLLPRKRLPVVCAGICVAVLALRFYI